MTNSYGYFSYGFGLPELFDANIGYRCQRNHNGFDIGLGVTPLVAVYDAHAYLNYLIYPSPACNQSYVGLGVYGGAAYVADHKIKSLNDVPLFIAPSLTLGKEFHNDAKDRRFIQATILPVSYVHHRNHKGWHFAPAIKIAYGFGF